MGGIIERLVAAQNSHDAEQFASYFAEEYRSEQPAHPGRSFVGRAQVLDNWTSVFEGVPDFEGELVAWSRTGDTEWGEVDWRGHHLDGATFAMRGVIVATVVDDLITSARLYVEPVEQQETGDIEAAVEQLYRPPR